MDQSDVSDILIEVLGNHFCRRLPFVYDHTMWIVVVRCQVDTVSVTGVKTAAMLWTACSLSFAIVNLFSGAIPCQVNYSKT